MKTLNKAMLIDDDKIDNYIYSCIIKSSGFAKNTVYFTDASTALANLARTMRENPDELPDIIFLDLSMPNNDGWDFLKEYEKLDRNYKDKIYLSILTSSLFNRDKDKVKKYSDVNAYLCKPLSSDELNKINEEINLVA